MGTIGVYSASDDLLEIEGEIREEHGCYHKGKMYVAFSHGAVISVEYDGEWKITKHSEPNTGSIEVHPAGSEEAEEKNSYSGDYSDYAEIESEDDAEWITVGEKIFKPSSENSMNSDAEGDTSER